MKHYDFIVAGGGLAGLSLALHIARSPLRDRSMLIVDRDAKERNDRTWCFWAETAPSFDEIVFRSWSQLCFAGENFERVIDLGAYDYRMLRAIDFYRFARAELSACPNVEFLRARVDGVDDGDGSARVTVGGHTVTGGWVFDSRFKPSGFEPDPARYHYLQQHFQGWVIETPGVAFDPQTVTFLDFRTPQKNEMRFFYVLPFSERQALVEFVLLSRDDYDQALKAYLENVLGIKTYRILAREAGVNPLTDYPFPRRTGRHVMTIGTPAGRIKPSSGYAFTRIQEDSADIVQSLLQAGHPFDVPSDPFLYRLCDSLMLQVMFRRGERIKPIFSAMFKNNPIERIFRFLDETTSLRENLLLIASMPPGLFLQAWFRLKVLGRV